MQHKLQDFGKNYLESSQAYYGLYYLSLSVWFLQGKRVHDNIIVAQEMLNSIHITKGMQGCLVMKIDLAKAYDRLN